MIKKEFILKLLEKRYAMFNYNSLHIIELLYNDFSYNDKQTNNGKLLSSIITTINADIWTYNEYRDTKLCKSYDKQSYISHAERIQSLLDSEIKKAKKNIDITNNYEVEEANYRVKKLDELKDFYNRIAFQFYTIAEVEEKENKIIKDSREIKKVCDLKEMELQGIA